MIKNEHHARDIVQRSFIKAYEKLNTYKGDAAFSTWLYRIVVNEAMMQIRKKPKHPISIDGSTEDIPAASLDDFDSKVTEDHQKYYIQESLMRISSRSALALKLFYMDEFSIAEIGQITGWSESNIKVILHRARKEMKQVLSDILNVDQEDLY